MNWTAFLTAKPRLSPVTVAEVVRLPGGQVCFAGGGDDLPTVEVGRRRRPGPGDSGPRERAEAPQRRRDDAGSAPPPTPPPTIGGGGGGSTPPPVIPGSSGGGTGGGGRGGQMSIMGLLVLLALCAVAYFVFGGLPGGDTPQAPSNDTPIATQAPTSSLPTVTTRPRPTRTPGGSGKDQKWLVMLYEDADDQILEQDIYVDLNEAERVGSNDNVQIVAQIDRYRGGYSADGNWVSAKRFLINKDNDLSTIHSEQVADLGEVNMADPNTLVDFATWAIQTYPADKYVLILSDHGMGWPGGWTDPTSSGRRAPNVPIAEAVGNQMFLMEMDDAFGKIRSNTGIDKFELIGLDACLMSSVEVLSALAPHSHYAVASEEVEPSLGWAYTDFLGALQQDPGMTGADLGQVIVDSYIRGDQRIVDDQARAEYARGGSVMGSLFGGPPSPDELTQELSRDVTLATSDLDALPGLMNSLNNLAFAMQGQNQQGVAQARNYAQNFTNIFGNSSPPPYIDLGNFVDILSSNKPSAEVARAIDQVRQSIDTVVVAEKHGSDKPGASGVSIYFPNSTLYRNPVSGPQSYAQVANRFAQGSLWDDFLAFHYTGRKFEAASNTVAIPRQGENVQAPAAGVQVSQLRLSSSEVAPGQTTTLSADVRGENVGYIKLFAGFYDRTANSINVADIDYLESPNTRQIDGVYYPDWGDNNAFTVQFDWEPIVFAISDGTNTLEALLTPETYGRTPEDTVYTVEGHYTYTNGEKRYARMYFRNGRLEQVFGYTGQDGTGAPREITPSPGDKFTVLQQWLDLDASGNATGIATQEGETLTFGDQPIVWEVLDAAAGDYVVGFIVEDLDANAYPTYAPVTVR
jgi:hypothetical protein